MCERYAEAPAAPAAPASVTIDPAALGYAAGGKKVSTRRAFGEALLALCQQHPRAVVIDGEVQGSTFAKCVATAMPERFVEGFIAEQNMVGAAIGLEAAGKLAVVTSFACFLSRAYDFVRMAGYSKPKHLVIAGSHAGVSVGPDGPSQMGLEDIAYMRPIWGSIVLYPSDAVSTARLVACAAEAEGIVYVRTSRPDLPVLYASDDTSFRVGGSKVVVEASAGGSPTEAGGEGKKQKTLRQGPLLVGAGVTLHECVAAHHALRDEHGVATTVLDAYSVKPLDAAGIIAAATKCGGDVVVVEDHAAYGGLGGAVCEALGEVRGTRVRRLAVTGPPRSGKGAELMALHGIDAKAVVAATLDLMK